MESETKVILKYKRECELWVCPECDTENSLVLGNCKLCGYLKLDNEEILNIWGAETENKEFVKSDEKENSDVYREAEENGKIILISCIIVIAVMIFVACLIYMNS